MGGEVPYFPAELLLNCFARISGWYYPSLSLVSKRFHSLIASKELYKTRKILGTTETCLHIILESESSSSSWGSWFSLCHGPTGTILSCWKNIMVSVPTKKLYPPPTWPKTWTLTAVGSDIYMIGGYIDGKPSTRVFVLDCLSHTCHEAPSMHVAREYPLVTVVDETIYVMEGYAIGNSQHPIEFFDTKTQIWETLPFPGEEMSISGCSVIEGNLYLFGVNKTVVYKPKENEWDVLKVRGSAVAKVSTCEVDNVSYHHNGRYIQWRDAKRKSWRDLRGSERPLYEFEENGYYDFVKIVNYDGKIAVFWEKIVIGKEEREIWCTEITLEKCNNGQEICVKTSRHDLVITLLKSSSFRSSASFKHFIVSTL